ncbi:hypothetical protein [Streptomyces goshikiensis]|uniref:hypothetical protein n=1 Tax=Streptomyces goshikiensis TaxID=1942 RepID=UPI00331BD4D5
MTWKQAQMPTLGPAGPAQSEHLIHFTSRGPTAKFGPDVPEEIRAMTPAQRLDSIIGAGILKGFRPFCVSQPCICLSESPPTHLAHLVTERGFAPWGIVITRAQALRVHGGAVAYVTTQTREQFVRAGLDQWAVRVDTDSQWMHEREWRVPLRRTKADGVVEEVEGVTIRNLAAIFIGDPDWRPTPVATGWASGFTGEQVPAEAPDAEPAEWELPALWRTTPIWVWDTATLTIVPHIVGALP